MCYTVDKGIVTDCRNLPNMGITSHEAVQLILGLGFDAIISGGIDYDMANELCASGVEVVAGVEGSPREVLDSYINHTLMGAVSFCHMHGEYDEEEDDEDLEAAFDAIAKKLEAAV